MKTAVVVSVVLILSFGAFQLEAQLNPSNMQYGAPSRSTRPDPCSAYLATAERTADRLGDFSAITGQANQVLTANLLHGIEAYSTLYQACLASEDHRGR